MSRATWSLVMVGMLLTLPSCATGGGESEVAVPGPPREFRAAWVATVANIDWPSKPGLPVSRQQAEAVAILDRLAELNFNVVVLQVRPHADAMYASELEPWSWYLTGSQGAAPEPYYDPLTFWIDAAHARGLELHAWFNPYRANHPAHRGPLSSDSVVKADPGLVVELGDKGYWWMDPALPAVQERSLSVILDVVRRYDIDGVHLDDYFYPYRSYNDGKDFPDDASWQAYRDGGGTASRGDFRRAAVDTFVERLYEGIKAEKAHVQFGISPFGIWRPGHPPSIQGLDQYDVLYADARRWLAEGWVDYFTPQLYWPIGQIPQSFPVLLGWWHRENVRSRHLWPGTSIARARGEAGATEIVNQLMITRGMTPHDAGLCMFSMKWLMGADDPLAKRLRAGPYKTPALVPSSPWLDDVPPPRPTVTTVDGDAGVRVAWTPAPGERAHLWVVAERRGQTWSHRILPGSSRSAALKDRPDEVFVSAIDRCGNASVPSAPRAISW